MIEATLEELAQQSSRIDRSWVEHSVRRWVALTGGGLPVMLFDAERQRQSDEAWEVLSPHLRPDISWPELLGALSEEENERLDAICGDRLLGEVLGIGRSSTGRSPGS